MKTSLYGAEVSKFYLVSSDISSTSPAGLNRCLPIPISNRDLLMGGAFFVAAIQNLPGKPDLSTAASYFSSSKMAAWIASVSLRL